MVIMRQYLSPEESRAVDGLLARRGDLFGRSMSASQEADASRAAMALFAMPVWTHGSQAEQSRNGAYWDAVLRGESEADEFVFVRENHYSG